MHLNEKVINKNAVDNSQYIDYLIVIKYLLKRHQWVSGSEIVCSKDGENRKCVILQHLLSTSEKWNASYP